MILLRRTRMMRKVPTQAERVLKYIKCFGGITRVEALMDIGVANLPAVIDDLRHKHGKHIITEEVKGTNRYGQSITYARYKFDESEDTISGN
jgi:hypothetical protein